MKCQNQLNATKNFRFSISIVEYNRHMSDSDENVQQRSFNSFHRSDNRYWWSLLIFFLDAIVLNAFKFWDRLYFDFTLIHVEFQHQIIESLLLMKRTHRKRSSNLIIDSFIDAVTKSTFCEWEFINKRSYCELCKKKTIKLRKRAALKEISANFIKKRRTSQTRWQCKSCDLCCKKNECWRALHSHSNA
jgi:hypothetical protein